MLFRHLDKRRQHDDRKHRVDLFQEGENRESVHIRQHQVQHHRGQRFRLCLGKGLGTGAGD